MPNTFLMLFFILVGILLVLFIGFSLMHDKYTDIKTGRKKCSCGSIDSPLFYKETIWGRKYKCVDCIVKQEKDGVNETFTDFIENE